MHLRRPRRATSILIAGAVVAASLSTAYVAAAAVQPRAGEPATVYAVIKTITVGAANPQPYAIAVDPTDDTVYVANYNAAEVSVINGRTGSWDDTVTVGSNPIGVAVNDADDSVYVTNNTSNTASIFNGRTLSPVSSIGMLSQPKGVAVDQSDDTVYIPRIFGANLAYFNGATPGSVSALSLGGQPTGVAVNSSDDTVYVTDIGGVTDVVWVVNGRTGSLDDTVNVGSNPFWVAVDQSDDTVYTSNATGNSVTVIKGSNRTVTGTISLGAGANPEGVAVNPADHKVFVANAGPDYVSVIDGVTGTRTDDTIAVGQQPSGVAVDDSGAFNAGLVYVANRNTGGPGSVSVIGKATPASSPSSGPAGTTVTLTLTVPNLAPGYVMDDSTVKNVYFDGVDVGTVTRGAGNTWTVVAPAGAAGSTAAVTVKLNGARIASAGTFTYPSPPGPAPAPQYPPGPPVGVTATGGDGIIGVSWRPPTDPGSFPVTEYRVTAQPGGASCTVAAPATACVLTGLTNGTTYRVTVEAKNEVGWGLPSSRVQATPGTPPGPPTNPTAVPGNGSATISWQAPASNGSTSITTYRVFAKPGGQTCFFYIGSGGTGGDPGGGSGGLPGAVGSASTPQTRDGQTYSCVVNGLTNGTTYTFTVEANNGSGWGPASVPSNPATPNGPRTYTTPGLYMCTVGGTGTQTMAFTVNGGKGGTGNQGTIDDAPAVPNPGGFGASVSGSFGVAAGTKLYMTVGANGTDAGVWDGWNSAGGGGGGYSAISLGDGKDPIVVAGGGGGGGYWNPRPGGGSGGTGGDAGAVAPKVSSEVTALSPRAELVWTPQSVPDNTWGATAYGDGTFVSARFSEAQPAIMTSPDGATWTARNVGEARPWAAVGYGSGTFVATTTYFSGRPAAAMWSTDKGVTWTNASIPNYYWTSVAFGNGTFVTVSGGGTSDGNKAATSQDGKAWVLRSVPASVQYHNWRSVTFGNGLFVAVAGDGRAPGNRVMTSPDGITWTARATPADAYWTSVTYGAGLFVAIARAGAGKRVMTSPDGITWTLRDAAIEGRWVSVAYGGGQFIAVGAGDTAMTSPDGITWTVVPNFPASIWNTVVYGADKFVVVARSTGAPQVITSSPKDTLPLAPTITAAGPRDGGAAISFTPPSNAAEAKVTDYEYQINGGAWIRVSPPPGSSNYFVIRGLTNGQRYSVAIRAVGSAGTGPASAPVQVTPGAMPYGGKGGNSDPRVRSGGGNGGDTASDGGVGGRGATPGRGGQPLTFEENPGGPGGDGGAPGVNGANATNDNGGAGGGGGGGFGAIGGMGSAEGEEYSSWSPQPGAYGGGGGGAYDGGGGGGGYAGGGGGAGGNGNNGDGGGGGGSSLLVSASTAAGITNRVDGTLAADSTAPSVTLPNLTCGFRIGYFGNDNTAGTVPTDLTWYEQGSTATAASGAGLQRGDEDFAGWSTVQFGPVVYAPGATIGPLAGPVTLWAVYAAKKTVTFDANGGTGTMQPQSSASAKPLAPNDFTRDGYAFSGWNTKADGSGTAFANGATYSFSSDVKLYAQWAKLQTVTFDSNGGTGTMAPQQAGVPTALELNAFTREGELYLTWNTRPDGSGTTYANGATYSFATDITLYAQWKKEPVTEPEPIPEPLEPGQSVVQIDGEVKPIPVAPNPENNAIVFDDSGWTMTLQGLGAKDAPLTLSPQGALVLEVQHNARSAGTGFWAQSQVTLYMDPQVANTPPLMNTVELGKLTVALDGTFEGAKPLPPSIRPGYHVLQAVGYGPLGQRRAISVGVIVRPWITLDQGTRKPAGRHDRIRTTGNTGGIDPGTRLTPWIRYVGQDKFKKGRANIVVLQDGSYKWTRLIKKTKGLTAYVSWTDIESNRVFWAKVR